MNAPLAAQALMLDPGCLLNPGKIVDPPKIDDARLFRFKPGDRTIELKPVYDWSASDMQNDPTTECTTRPGTGATRPAASPRRCVLGRRGATRRFDAIRPTRVHREASRRVGLALRSRAVHPDAGIALAGKSPRRLRVVAQSTTFSKEPS